jgi:hypothetical protein
MNHYQSTATATAVLLLSACSTVPSYPQFDYALVDPQRTDLVAYDKDYNECAALANQASVGNSAAGGAVIGAGVGALLGALLCGRQCAAWGAGYGAGYGGTSGAISATVDQQSTLRNCLVGRGYHVIR